MTVALGVQEPDGGRRTQSVLAAELVLTAARGQAVHYRDIAAEALTRGLWSQTGRTPWHTLNRDIRKEVLRAQAEGKRSPFVRVGRGYIALVPDPEDAAAQVLRHRFLARQQLIDRLHVLHPRTFEHVIAELLRRMAFESVSATRYSGDGGVDVSATWACRGVLRQRVVVQVKRTRRNVGQRVVREFRGALDHDERGLLVSTSGFQPSAARLAEAANKKPIALLGGEQLADLLIEHELGVRLRRVALVEMSDFDLTADRTSASCTGTVAASPRLLFSGDVATVESETR